MTSAESDYYFSEPACIRQLGDAEFEEFWQSAVAAHDFLFKPGRFQGDELRYHEDKVVHWMIALGDQSRGEAMVIPELPRSILDWAAVLAEEFITRMYSGIALGILADMCLRRPAYAQLWESFNEYEVWRDQLSCALAREHCRKHPWKKGDRMPSPNRDEVLSYRSDFLRRIAAGSVIPLRPDEIVARGLMLFDNRRECTDSGAVTDMLKRFGSKLRVVSSETMAQDKPYTFVLGYTEKTSWHHMEHDGKKHRIGVEHIGLTLARSPALAPDAMGWTPD